MVSGTFLLKIIHTEFFTIRPGICLEKKQDITNMKMRKKWEHTKKLNIYAPHLELEALQNSNSDVWY